MTLVTHTKHCMLPSASWHNDRKWRQMWAYWAKRGNLKNAFHLPMPTAQSAVAQMPGECWPSKPILFRWETTRPHMQDCISSFSLETGKCNLKVWRICQLTGAQKPCKTCAFCLSEMLEGAVLGDMAHAEHPNPCRADPSCLLETQGSSGQ